jgi:hypothetical protein
MRRLDLLKLSRGKKIKEERKVTGKVVSKEIKVNAEPEEVKIPASKRKAKPMETTETDIKEKE